MKISRKRGITKIDSQNTPQEKTQEKGIKNNSKYQSVTAIGIGLIVIGIVLIIIAFSKNSSADFSDVLNNSVNRTSVRSDVLTSDEVTSKSYSCYEKTEDESHETELTVSYPIDINTCTIDELMTIDGIGEAKADAIIQYREYLGKYTSVEQIKNIKGFGDAVYERVSPYLTV
ncbi:MAG: helix-hairpin-helix domain-containing protein [Acetobacter sp.]|nr:helix-hairpin-helix domain-containing protein [Bacteroides sp.]MCM1341367.1 helix-hairpin-helix domain-containing protein [Acetobacter sp.]MCM1433459.1 helix-hairpin-helix domain-containing protein [Clostridiales bacterium]